LILERGREEFDSLGLVQLKKIKILAVAQGVGRDLMTRMAVQSPSSPVSILE